MTDQLDLFGSPELPVAAPPRATKMRDRRHEHCTECGRSMGFSEPRERCTPCELGYGPKGLHAPTK